MTGAAKGVGFTGTRRGLTLLQLRGLRQVLEYLRGRAFHHGDCVGADAEAHAIARSLGYVIVAHPPALQTHRANMLADRMLPSRTYLRRNRDIVDACEILIAAPAGTKEVPHSGTWATVRYARLRGIPIIFLYPKGELP